MSIESVNMPTCAGCCVKQPEMYIEMKPDFGKFELFVQKEGLTSEEKSILTLLASAWDVYNNLKEKHPQENSEFLDAIHRAQHIIAYRVARRIDKDVWKQWD